MTTNNRKPMRRIEDLTLKEMNEIFARISEILGVPNIETAIDAWRQPLTTEQSAVMLTQVLAQVDEVFNG